MRHGSSVLVLGLFALAFANQPAGAAPADPAPKATAVAASGGNYSRVDGRWWYRTAEGQRYVYSCNQWVRIPSETADAGTAQAAAPQASAPQQRMVRRYSVQPPVIISYPNDGPPDVSHGVDWYRNGRGNFSD
jgi:hypothetical protein